MEEKWSRGWGAGIFLMLCICLGCRLGVGAAIAQAAAEPERVIQKNYLAIGFDLLKEEMIGSLKIGHLDADIIKNLGVAEEKFPAEIWGADGLEHQKWNYPRQGMLLGMVRSGMNQQVDRINVKSPCEWKTKRGIGIGSSAEEVRSAYRDELNPGDSMEKCLVAGSIYGGILFKLENGQVVSIFIGAAAE